MLTEVEKHEKDNSVKFIPSAVKDLSDQFCVVVFFSALVPCSVDAPYQGKDFEDRLELKLWKDNCQSEVFIEDIRQVHRLP